MKKNTIFMLTLIGFLASVNLQAAQPQPATQASERVQPTGRSLSYRLTAVALVATGIAGLACSKDSFIQLCGAGLVLAGGAMVEFDRGEQSRFAREEQTLLHRELAQLKRIETLS